MTSQEGYGVWSVTNAYDSLFKFSIVTIGLGFVVGLISGKVSFLNLGMAYWMFRVGIGLLALLVFLKLFVVVQNFVSNHFYAPMKKIKQYKDRIEKEQKEIRRLLKFEIGREIDEELLEHYYDLENAEFSKEALAPYLTEWHNHVNEVYNLIQEDERTEKLEEFKLQKELLSKEIKDLKKEKEQISKGEKYNAEKETFFKKYEDVIHVDSSDLEERQKRWLEEAGFVRTHQWCINKKDSVEFLIKPRHNESLSHAYLTSAIFEYVKKLDANAKLSTTKTADIIFSSKNSCWAVEVETGKVYEKSKQQLLEKVKVLDEKFPERWFFVVTNKNLLSKYHKLGGTIDRSGIIGRVDEIFSSK